LLVPTFILGIAGVAIFLGNVRVSDAGAQPQRDSTVVRVIEDIYGKRRIFEVMLDVGLIVLAYYGAYVLRYEGSIPPGQAAIMGRTLPLVIVITELFLLLGGVYRAMWRYVGVDELVVLARSVGSGALVSALVVFALNPGQPISRTTFVLEALLLLLFIGGSRLSYRVMRVLLTRQTAPPAGARPVIIYGAGDGGELVMREILNNPGHRYAPIGFVDDDGRKAGRSIHGYRIFRSQELPDLIRRHGVEEILVSTRQVPEGELDALRRLGVRPKRVSIDFE
jgi:UDP-GlcNAc:undecaprenyl-phosphate GlcNAc-1-phosphate transferase